MKIFPKDSIQHSTSVQRPTRSKQDSSSSHKKAGLPVKKEMSDSAIREKLAAHVDTSDAAKNMAIKNTKKLGENFMSDTVRPIVDIVDVVAPNEEEIKTPNTKDLTIKSDIALNDPKDTNTQEKLKSALTRGAFNFNPKEREALEKILAG